MFDAYGRNIHYLRLSVTDLCNLRCRYCMPDGVEKLEREAVLTDELLVAASTTPRPHRRRSLQPLQGPQLQRFHPAAGFPNAEENFD